MLRRRVCGQRDSNYARRREELREHPGVHQERHILQATAQVRGAEAAQEGRQQRFRLQEIVGAHPNTGPPAGRNIRRRAGDGKSRRVDDESRPAFERDATIDQCSQLKGCREARSVFL